MIFNYLFTDPIGAKQRSRLASCYINHGPNGLFERRDIFTNRVGFCLMFFNFLVYTFAMISLSHDKHDHHLLIDLYIITRKLLKPALFRNILSREK